VTLAHHWSEQLAKLDHPACFFPFHIIAPTSPSALIQASSLRKGPLDRSNPALQKTDRTREGMAADRPQRSVAGGRWATEEAARERVSLNARRE